MRIGTAVPSAEELASVKHHLIQHVSITHNYDVARYEQEALNLLNNLFTKHSVVILTGGTGLYVDAVCRGLDNIPETAPEIRERVNQLYMTQGIKALQNEVKMLDPEYYEFVDTMNPRRLHRALEVIYQTGRPFSFYRKRKTVPRPFEVIWTAIDMDRQQLHNRINLRVEKMLSEGLIAEVKSLAKHKHLNALNTVGYKELFAYFEGEMSMNEALEKIKTNTRQYAKRQLTWLRKNTEYKWFKKDDFDGLLNYVLTQMKG
jgi:tRNA dimethylallyltransferase